MDARASRRVRRVVVLVGLAGVGVALAYWVFKLALVVVTLD